MARQSDRGTTPPLVGPRLSVPRMRPGVVSRARLLDVLDRGLAAGRPMTLVAAPAGYGKTTLVVEWLRRLGRHVAWITIDDPLNDPGLFLTYLGAAIGRSGLPASTDSVSAVGGYGRPSVDALVPLVNDLEQPGDPLVVVLDDYQVISVAEIHDLVGFLVSNAPARLHVVVLTREDPQLPLARLRASDHVTEIREAQLRFTVDEAGRFYRESAGLDLSAEQVATLADRTEGWAAGLQLAGLSLQGVTDAEAFVGRFSGTDRFVLDYLVDEVLARQGPEIVDFLRKTCVLARLSGPLCDALTGRHDGSRTLGALEAASLFVISLDERREWYRYHPLFAEVLQSLVAPDDVRALHAAAARWHAAHGSLADAVSHSLAAGDHDGAAALIETGLDQTIADGSFLGLERWLAQLPGETFERHPALAIGDAWARLMLGDLPGAENRLRSSGSSGSGSSLSGDAAHRTWVLRSWIANRRDSEDAEDIATAAIERVPETDRLFRALAFMSFGEIAFRRNAAASAPAHAAADEISARLGRPPALFGTIWNLGLAYTLSGERQRAIEVSLAALAGRQDRSGRWQGLGANALVPLGMAEYEGDELEAAIEHLELGLELCQRAGIRPVVHGTVDWYLIMALDAVGRRERAVDVAQTAHAEATRLGMPFAAALLNVSLAELSRRAGDRVDAERRLRGVPDEFETARFVRIRLALADGRAESALGEAESLTAEEIRAGRVPRLAAAHALAALALDGLGRRADALARLGTALSLVAPGTYRRAILDQGSGVGRLLRLVDPRSEAVEAFRSDLLTRLEDAPSRGEPGAPIAPEHTPRNRGGLVEHLGNRELDVLPLLAAGLSNADIARALYIGPGTAKWHVHNILAKLGIERRAQVAIRARELGLLPK